MRHWKSFKEPVMLSIIINNKDYNIVQSTDPSLYPETVNIAGKEILIYWLEWARANGDKTLHIYTLKTKIEKEKIEKLFNLFGIEIIYHLQSDITNKSNEENNSYYGIGIFLDNGVYNRIKSFNELLKLEENLISRPLHYSSPIGYDNNTQIQIGKNVYIHASVQLSGYIVIGDDCIIEKDVIIRNSIINNNVLIKEGSYIENSHIESNLKILDRIYLQNKALFQSNIYCKKEQHSLAHYGICIVH